MSKIKPTLKSEQTDKTIYLKSIDSKNTAIFEALEQDKHSFARSQAIEFVHWIHESDSLYYDNVMCAWRTIDDTETYSDDDLYSQFLLWQEKQQEGKGE